MLPTILENALLYELNNFSDRLMAMLRDLAQRHMAGSPCCGELECAVQVALWHVVDASDIGNGHPVPHGTHVADRDQGALALEGMERLHGAGCGQHCASDCQRQQGTDNDDSYTRTHNPLHSPRMEQRRPMTVYPIMQWLTRLCKMARMGD